MPPTPADKDTRPYIAVANSLFRHPKFVMVSKDARLHLLELWAHCNEYRTDGRVHKAILDQAGKKVSEELLGANWVEHHEGDWFYMHDYLKHQKSADELADAREQKQQRGRRGAHVRFHENRGITDPDCAYCNS